MIEIPKYNGLYLVSKDGTVYSNKRKRNLKPYKSVRGYLVLTLKGKTRAVHQLVVETYLDSEYKSKGLVVDHINRDKTDNRLDNLRLVNKSENFKNSNYFETRKKGCIHVRPSGSYRAIITTHGVRKDKTFKNLEDAKIFLENNK